MTNKKSNTNIKVLSGIAVFIVVVAIYVAFTQFIKPETLIKDDISATQELFGVIDKQMLSNGHNAYMSLDPTGHVMNLVNVINSVGMDGVEPPYFSENTTNYYLDYAQHPDSTISVRYSVNFDQSKVDNVYLIRKIDHEDYFSFNAHATLSHIIFDLNKMHNIRPSTSLRLELTPIKMKNGEAYHYFANENKLNTPVAFDSCKESMDCVYVSRYKSTVPRPL